MGTLETPQDIALIIWIAIGIALAFVVRWAPNAAIFVVGTLAMILLFLIWLFSTANATPAAPAIADAIGFWC